MEEKELTEFEWEMRGQQQLVDPENCVPCISSAALMDQEFTPAEFVVKGFLPKGLCVLGGAPKVGKSWLVLDLCLHVAKGEPFLGMEVKQGTAWYLSLEELELEFDKTNFVWRKVSDSKERDMPLLPPEMVRFVEFIRSVGGFEGGNTELAEAFAQYSGIVLPPKVLKQKMNRWCSMLADAGVRFQSRDTNHGKVVCVTYTPTSHTSQN